MACKAAVKANDYLTQLEMEKLISDLRYIDNPFNCPHGRPIIIKFTEYELKITSKSRLKISEKRTDYTWIKWYSQIHFFYGFF